MKAPSPRREHDAGALQDMIGEDIVVDLRSSYVCLGTLVGLDETYLHLKDADLHDLRDTTTTRENYVVSSHHTGIKRNRKKLLLTRAEIVAIAKLSDVADE